MPADSSVIIRENFPLKDHNTFSISAKAKYFTEIETTEQLKEIFSSEQFKNEHKLILGGGSNLLFTKDFDGLVIKNNLKGIEKIYENNDYALLKVGAGENWHEFVLSSIKENLSGIENLSLIPGTVGAAPMQNIGAYGVEIKDVFYSLEAFDIATGEIKEFLKDECNFGYRESIFKKELKGKYIIVSVTFKLSKNHKINISYGAIKDTLTEMNIANPTIKDVSDAVSYIRSTKLPDPKVIGNAGSFFKNPEIDQNHFQVLKEKYPDIVSYPIDENKVKIPAGWLIEKAGWKGKTFENYGVHKNQALVLVNYGEAKGEQINNLADQIQTSIFNDFGIKLDKEVNII